MRRNARAWKVIAAFATLAAGSAASGIGPSLTEAYGAPLWSQLEASPSSQGARAGGASSIITYAEEAPCDPAPVASAGDPARGRPRLVHKIRRRPVVHKILPSKPAAVVPKPMPVVHRPIVHPPLLHKVVARAHRRRLHVARLAAVAPPKRCVTLHSERLTSADLVTDVAPAAALVGPAAFEPPDATPDFGLSGDGGDSFGGSGGAGGGGGAFSNPASGGVGGGGVIADPGHSSGSVSAAPEPSTWMLMILGVGLCGGALRRGRRAAPSAV